MVKYRLIGKGAYSNVVSPPIQCSHNIKYLSQCCEIQNDDVGKIFTGYDKKVEFEEELRILRQVSIIQNYTDFTVTVKVAFSFDKNDLQELELTSLEGFSILHKQTLDNGDNIYNNDMLYQIIFENGGVCINKIRELIPFEKCMNMLKQLFIGLNTLHEHNIVHRDIKPANVLYNGFKFNIIDFGLSCNEDIVYDYDSSKYILNFMYPYHPPEFYIMNLFYKHNCNLLNFHECLSITFHDLTNDTNILKSYYKKHFYKYRVSPKTYQIEDYKLEFKNIYDYIINKKINNIDELCQDNNFILKSEVYSLSCVLYKLKDKIVFDTKEQENKYDEMINMSSVFNPFERCSLKDLLESIDK